MASFKNLIGKFIPRVDGWAGQVKTAPRRAKKIDVSLVKSRPPSIETDYEILEDSKELDHLFGRMREQILHNDGLLSSKRGPSMRPLRESGRIAPERPYFFIKPLNETGLLFERSGAGWVVSKAEKIVQEDTFIRSSNVWDVVTIYSPRQGVSGTARVSSERLGLDRVAFQVYTQALAENMAEQWSESGA
jgi:hypothetical protein